MASKKTASPKIADRTSMVWEKLNAADGRIAVARMDYERFSSDETPLKDVRGYGSVAELIAAYDAARTELNEAIAAGKTLFAENIDIAGTRWAGYATRSTLTINAVRLYELLEEKAEPLLVTELKVNREAYLQAVNDGQIPVSVMKEVESVSIAVTSPKGAR